MKTIKHLLFALIFTVLVISGILGYSYYIHKKSVENFENYFFKTTKLKYKSKKIHLSYAELKNVEITLKPNQQAQKIPFFPQAPTIKMERIIIKSFSVSPVKMDISYINIDTKGSFKISKFLNKLFATKTQVSIYETGHFKKNTFNKSTNIVIQNVANIKITSKTEFPSPLKLNISNLYEELKKGKTKEVNLTFYLEKAASSKIKRISKDNYEKLLNTIDTQIINTRDLKQKNNLKKIKSLLIYVEKKAYRLESQPIYFSISIKNLNQEKIINLKNPANLFSAFLTADLEITTH